MKHLSISIPDSKYQFVLELIQSLGFIQVEQADDIHISEEHKAIVRQRIAAARQNPDRLLDWDQVQDSFDLD